MIIKSQQIASMRAKLNVNVETSIINCLNENYKYCIEGISDQMVRDMVKTSTFYAKSFNLKTNYSIVLFGVLMFISAPNFFEYPIANEILGTKLTDNDRMDRIVNHLQERDWEYIRSKYNESIWLVED